VRRSCRHGVPGFGLFIAFLVLCSVSLISAKEMRWESVPLRTAQQKAAGMRGGEGFQYVYAIAYAPNDTSIVYMATDTSQVWKSSDGGFSWESRNRGFIAHGARSLGVDPVNSNVIFAAGFLGYEYDKSKKYKNGIQGIFRSVDGGDTWTLVKKTGFYGQESKGCLFAFDTRGIKNKRTSVVFAASYDEGLLCSDNGGDTWKTAGFRGIHILDMKANPSVPGEIILATREGLFKYSKGLVERIGAGLPTWPRSIAISRQRSKVVYAALGKSGIYRSSDEGKTFTQSNYGLPAFMDFTDIAVSPVDSDIVYVKAHLSSSKPYYSHDGGRSWNVPKTTNLGNLVTDEGFWFSSPITPHPKEARTALTVSNGRARILKTNDGGINWGYSGNGFAGGRMIHLAVDASRMIFFLTDHGVWSTQDDGSTFVELPVKRVSGLKSSSSGDLYGNTIVASVGSWGKKSLEVSHDLGKTWKVYDDLVDNFRFIAFHPGKNGYIYAGNYRSQDGGRRWGKLAETIVAMYHGNGDIVYAVSSQETKTLVKKSTNRGDSWQSPYPLLPFSVGSVNDISISADDPDRIYIATTVGVWFFDGKRWILRNARNGLDKDNFGLCHISRISVDPNNPSHVYAGRAAPGYGPSNGVFVSRDRGLTWKNITFNLGPPLTVWSVEVNKLNSDVYIGTSLGTWRLIEDRKQK